MNISHFVALEQLTSTFKEVSIGIGSKKKIPMKGIYRMKLVQLFLIILLVRVFSDSEKENSMYISL